MKQKLAYQLPNESKTNIKLWIALGIFLLAGLASAYIYRETLQNYIQHPATIPVGIAFFAIAILPALGCPVSILYGLTGAAYENWTAVAVVVSGITANATLIYLLAQRLLHKPVLNFLHKKGYAIPQASPKNEWKLVFITRICLFVPLTIQNYVLSLARVSFVPYILLAILMQGTYGSIVALIAGSAPLQKFVKELPYKTEVIYVAIGGMLVYGLLKYIRSMKQSKHL